VEFEFDPLKSETNKAKNGIDFVKAQALWRSKHVLLGAKDASEKRYMAIGRIGLDYFDVRKGVLSIRPRRLVEKSSFIV
jgi:uncharacterized protein